MKKKHNILLIAYTFPPLPFGGTYRSLRLCKQFSEMDINLHVLTINIYKDIPNDFSLLRQVPELVKIHRTPIIDPYRAYRSKKNKFSTTFFYKCANKIIPLLLRFITVPDHMVLWNITAIPAALKIIDKYNIDSVLVSSPPDSTLFIGYVVKKLRKIKWVADLRDPIVGNVAAVDLIKNNDIITIFIRKFLKSYNRLIIKNADVTIANTNTHLRQLKVEFPEKKVFTVRNSYDEGDFTGSVNLKYNVFTISHLGSYYGLRSADLIFKAVKRLEASVAPKDLKLQILFYGLHDSKLDLAIKKHGVEKYVKVNDIVPHHEAIQVMRASHLLLLLKATGKEALGQIPGKFFEYVGSKNKIFCIGPENCEVGEIIKKYELGYIIENDEKKALRILKDNYSKFLAGDHLENKDTNLKKFSSNIMAQKILSIIEKE